MNNLYRTIIFGPQAGDDAHHVLQLTVQTFQACQQTVLGANVLGLSFVWLRRTHHRPWHRTYLISSELVQGMDCGRGAHARWQSLTAATPA